MNLLNKCTTNEIKLLENIGINIEYKEYLIENKLELEFNRLVFLNKENCTRRIR